MARTLRQVSDRFVALRDRRTYRWLERLTDHFNRHDFWSEIAPPFQQLKDDSLIFSGRLRGFRLQPGPNLQSVPFVTYPLTLRRPHLVGLLLAPVLDIPLNEGQLGIELVSPENQIVAQVVVPAQPGQRSRPGSL